MYSWNKTSLNQLASAALGGARLIAVSNREPYIHMRHNGCVECMQPASGMVSAVDPILRASGGTWVAHGSGTADRETADKRGRVRVPPDRPAYTLRRVWLDAQLEREYYGGLANEGLWPLCHVAFQRPRFQQGCWDSYRRANRLFADAVLEEAAGEAAFVLIQDYHFGLLPRMLKEANPRLTLAHFWHIPWPAADIFRAFPWKCELLEGMLGSDLTAFQLREHCFHFLEAVERNTDASVDRDRCSAIHSGHSTAVRALPISIDFNAQARAAASSEVAELIQAWQTEIGAKPEILAIGIDRIDYTKGIPERLAAISALFQEYPEYLGRFTFVQVGVPSRTSIPEYQALNQSIGAEVDAVNRRWGRGSWKPVVFIRRQVNQTALVALHLMADICVVSSLDDGMNLVAKEFVASRIDEDGVLVLSAFAGAAHELTDALIVNPYAAEEVAGAIHKAISMPPAERHRRMARMRRAVAANNVYRWAGKLLSAMCELDRADEPAVAQAEVA